MIEKNDTDLEKLIQSVKEANIAYSAGMPFMTDTEYDALWQQLHAIDPDNHLLYHTAQSYNKVHGKTFHKHQVFGTNKAFNMEDLKPFLMRFGSQALVIEPKYDGCAAIMTKNKQGYILTLEGDGKSGNDITHLIPFIEFPFHLRNFQAVEILLPVTDWNPKYGKNPRNVVAGWLARKHEKPDAIMTAVPHNFAPMYKDYKYDGNVEALGELLIKTHVEWSKFYPIDGLMLKVKEEKSRLIAGNNGTTNTWSIAWKPPIQVKQTKVTDIEWNISRLGRLIPTVVYHPIDLCGTTNSRVTGNNSRWIIDKNIKIGSKITVGKAGEIIPKIIEIENIQIDDILLKNESLLSEGNFNYKEILKKIDDHPILPEHCPTCGELLQWEGRHLKCNGLNCISQKVVSIAYFYSTKGIKVDGIGEQTIEKLLRNENCYKILIKKPWALLDMDAYKISDDVKSVLGQTIYNNILREVSHVNRVKNMSHFVAGLGKPGLAYKSSLKLCQYIKTGKLSQYVNEKAMKYFFESALIFQAVCEEMVDFKFLEIPNPAKAKYCITGTLSMSREVMIEMLNNYEFEFSQAVTKDTNYLVVGNDAGKTKINKAIRYNIPQINEVQLHTILNKEY